MAKPDQGEWTECIIIEGRPLAVMAKIALLRPEGWYLYGPMCPSNFEEDTRGMRDRNARPSYAQMMLKE